MKGLIKKYEILNSLANVIIKSNKATMLDKQKANYAKKFYSSFILDLKSILPFYDKKQ